MSPEPAESQLERILHILAAASQPGGARYDDLARELGVDVDTVKADIDSVTTREFYHPAGAVDRFNVLLEHDRVKVRASEFRRPARLNERETLALCLGLRALAADATPERRLEILAFARRVEEELRIPDVYTVHEMRDTDAVVSHMRVREEPSRVPDDVEVDTEDYVLAFDDDGFRGVIADAIELGRTCTISYLKAGDTAPGYRSIAPYRLVYANGLWYVASYDLDREAPRFFRMDRVLDAHLEDTSAPELPDPELEQLIANGAPYIANDEVEVRVRYSPRVARWVSERTLTYADEDGTVTIHYRVADPRWIVRHVLQYGGEAEIVEPEEARSWVAEAAAGVGAPFSIAEDAEVSEGRRG